MSVLYIAAGLVACVLVASLLLYFTKTRLRFEQKTAGLSKFADVPAENWEKLSKAKIFFGHQSVGYNIVDGLKDVFSPDAPVKLDIVEMSSSSDFERPGFVHAQVGRNKQPVSKIERFVEIINAGGGDKVDIAFLKFCYVDITNDCNPSEIFGKYKAAVDDLEKRYPRIKFLHFTAPLKSPPKGAKRTINGFAKWLLNIPTAIDDNLKREQYNQSVRDTYGNTGRVFDLAFVESAGPDGLACYVEGKGQRIPFMVPQYTNDGGHLNEQGRRIVAEQLLIKLSEVAAQNP